MELCVMQWNVFGKDCGEQLYERKIKQMCKDYPWLVTDAMISGVNELSLKQFYLNFTTETFIKSISDVNSYPMVRIDRICLDNGRQQFDAAIKLEKEEFYFVRDKCVKDKQKAMQVEPQTIKNCVPNFNANLTAIDAAFSHQIHGITHIFLFYKQDKQQHMFITQGDFKTIAKPSIMQVIDENLEVKAIDLFKKPAIDKKYLGLKAIGDHSFLFEIDATSSKIDLSPIAPAFDNQVFFGCPLTHCFLSNIDAIEMFEKHNESKLLVFWNRFFWVLNGTKQRIASINAKVLPSKYFKGGIDAVYSMNSALFFVKDNTKTEVILNDNLEIENLNKTSKLAFHLSFVDAICSSCLQEDELLIFKEDKFYELRGTSLVEDDLKLKRQERPKTERDLYFDAAKVSSLLSQTVLQNYDKKRKEV
ncbi:hypothetical protein B4U79_17617 [Dinothrombium tinctorium]|uniref:Uncharacterized protein n=1 Tax=Dinothrombium tinctorium TaxID=1965070 RepID=A0A443R5C8_9ACAR|nr:hypothetical protein B4U79_17617 [Dinothrombium tinctorium]